MSGTLLVARKWRQVDLSSFLTRILIVEEGDRHRKEELSLQWREIHAKMIALLIIWHAKMISRELQTFQ